MNSTSVIIVTVVSVIIVLIIIGVVGYLMSKKKKQSRDINVIVPDVTTPVEPGDNIIIPEPIIPDVTIPVVPDVTIPVVPDVTIPVIIPEVPLDPDIGDIASTAMSGQFNNNFDQLGEFIVKNRINVITLTNMNPIDIQLTHPQTIFKNNNSLEYFEDKRIISELKRDDVELILDKDGNIVVIVDKPTRLIILPGTEIFRYNYTHNIMGKDPINTQVNHINPVWENTFNDVST